MSDPHSPTDPRPPAEPQGRPPQPRAGQRGPDPYDQQGSGQQGSGQQPGASGQDNPYAAPAPQHPQQGQGRPQGRYGQQSQQSQPGQQGQQHPHGQPGQPGQQGQPGQDPAQSNKDQGKPERPTPTPEEAAEVSRPVLHFGLFMLAAVIAMQLDLPWQLASLAFAVGAIIVGIRGLVRVFKKRIGGFIAALLIFGLALTGMLVLTSVGNLALWDEQMERQRCLNAAVTVAAQDACESAYTDAVEERFGTMIGGG